MKQLLLLLLLATGFVACTKDDTQVEEIALETQDVTKDIKSPSSAKTADDLTVAPDGWSVHYGTTYKHPSYAGYTIHYFDVPSPYFQVSYNGQIVSSYQNLYQPWAYLGYVSNNKIYSNDDFTNVFPEAIKLVKWHYEQIVVNGQREANWVVIVGIVRGESVQQNGWSTDPRRWGDKDKRILIIGYQGSFDIHVRVEHRFTKGKTDVTLKMPGGFAEEFNGGGLEQRILNAQRRAFELLN